jgi:hypothetical protein
VLSGSLNSSQVNGGPPPGCNAVGEFWIEKLWNSGQRLLVAGEYTAARRELEAAEAAAYVRRSAGHLARIYLPLLEACRQLRQLSAEGMIVIDGIEGRQRPVKVWIRRLTASGGGVIITASPMTAERIYRQARLLREPVECLLLVESKEETRIVSPMRAGFSCGLPVVWRPVESAVTPPAQPEQMQVSLPPAGEYPPGSRGHAAVGESIILLYEALALKYLRRHELPMDTWGRIAALRRIRMIDMACEPVTIRLMDEAERVAAQGD